MAGKVEEELPDFDEADATEQSAQGNHKHGGREITASGFKDFLLKESLMQGIIECGFEHPSEVQHAAIPQAVLGTDVLCQAKSGMGKTAVFVLACIQTVDLSEKALRVIVLCHTRELAYQIEHEFLRLGKHLEELKVCSVYGGVPMEQDKEKLKKMQPHIVVGTPGRVLQLIKGKDDTAPLKLDKLTHFIVDECDRCVDEVVLRRDLQNIFIKTPKKKQVMMFSATISPETRATCKRFMQGPHEITVDPAKLRLDGLSQYIVKLEEKQKNKKLIDMLDNLEFNQVVIFVKNVKRALALNGLLNDSKFPSMTLHELPKEFGFKAKGDSIGADASRIDRLKMFKDFRKRILVTTDLFGRGMDVEKVNIVINYDMPEKSDNYLHRVGRAGRFGTKGLAVSFVSSDEDKTVMEDVQAKFEVALPEMPEQVDTTSYLNA